MLAFKVFVLTDTKAIDKEIIKVDPADSTYKEQIEELRELQKDKKVYIAPLDADSVTFLRKPKQRGRAPLHDDIIVLVHELRVEQKKTPMQIMLEVYNRFNVELSSKLLNDILSQKKYADVPNVDHLRQQALDMMPKKADRKRKITDEMKQEWVRLHVEENMSGNAISKLYDVSSPSVNVHLRSQFGYRKKTENK